MRPGSQVIALKNEHTAELVARLERTIARDDALTAARAASLALFRELFPGEVLSAGNLVSVATVTLLVTDLELPSDMYAKLGDAPAFGIIHEHFRLLDERIRKAGGALVKTVGEGVLAVFEDPLTAVETALDLQAVLAAGETTRALRLKAAVHRGPAMAATLNDHLDYFGATVREAMLLPALVRGGEIVLTAPVAGDTRVAALLMELRRASVPCCGSPRETSLYSGSSGSRAFQRVSKPGEKGVHVPPLFDPLCAFSSGAVLRTRGPLWGRSS